MSWLPAVTGFELSVYLLQHGHRCAVFAHAAYAAQVTPVKGNVDLWRLLLPLVPDTLAVGVGDDQEVGRHLVHFVVPFHARMMLARCSDLWVNNLRARCTKLLFPADAVKYQNKSTNTQFCAIVSPSKRAGAAVRFDYKTIGGFAAATYVISTSLARHEQTAAISNAQGAIYDF